MIHKFNYNLLLKLTIFLGLLCGTALAINLWLYFQPSSAEIALARFLQFGRPDWLTTVMKYLSDSYIALGMLAGGACLWSLLTKRYATATVLAISLASLLLIDPLKLLFQRPRPTVEIPIVDYIAGSSFPSGHAYTATVLASALCLAYLIGWRGKNVAACLALSVSYVMLMAWSRVYLQVHYPSDVVGGVLFGLVTIILLGLIYRWLIRLRTRVRPHKT